MEHPFVTLEPTNPLAKMGFSEVFEAIMRRNTPGNIPAAHRMEVGDEPKYHQDVFEFRLGMGKPSQGDFSSSPTETELDDNTKSRAEELATIWTGRYTLQLKFPPSEPSMGWVAGKGPGEKNPHADILFCTRSFAKRHNLQLRTFHARFNFDRENCAFFIASIHNPSLAGVSVNGLEVSRQIYALNQHSMRLRVGQLEYDIRYTENASSIQFKEDRAHYLTTILGERRPILFDMPTPRRGTRTIGQWTLGNPLGKGSAGKVYLASNSKNEMVAVKIIEVNSESSGIVDQEIAAHRDLTVLAKKHDSDGRIVRLKETIDPRDGASLSSSVFYEVALILEPMAPKTLCDLVGKGIKRGYKGMSDEAACVFRDALLGLKVMHSNGWVHRDIKPSNIGVMSRRAVLLDLGQAKHLKPGCMLPATPGCSGTIGYLAPEREMTEYDQLVDIWAMGCIAFELMYGYLPFNLQANPWRRGIEDEQKREIFHTRYQEAVDKLSVDYTNYVAQSAADRNRNFVHLGDLVIKMLRHPFARSPLPPRINVEEALEHPGWKPLLSDDTRGKRVRVKT